MKMQCKDIEFERQQAKDRLDYYNNQKQTNEQLIDTLRKQIDNTQQHARVLWRKYITAQTPELRRNLFNERSKILKEMNKQAKQMNDAVTAVEGLSLQIELTQNEFDDLETLEAAMCVLPQEEELQEAPEEEVEEE